MKKLIKSLIISVIALILVTVGIDAADNFDNLSESIVGRVIFGEGDGPCPSDMVFIPTENNGFCIDRYEASPGGDCPFEIITNQLEAQSNFDLHICEPVSEVDRKPWRFVSQTQAQTICAKAGKRLPTSEEWYLASLATPDLNNNWQKEDCHVANNWSEQPGSTGSGFNCVSAYGAYDMIGNVWEWVKGEARDGVIDGEKLPEDGYIIAVDSNGLPLETNFDDAQADYNNDYLWLKDQGVRALARGGYWDNEASAGLFSMYIVSPPTFKGAGIGFRCAK